MTAVLLHHRPETPVVAVSSDDMRHENHLLRDLYADSQALNRALNNELRDANRRIARLEKELSDRSRFARRGAPGTPSSSATPNQEKGSL